MLSVNDSQVFSAIKNIVLLTYKSYFYHIPCFWAMSENFLVNLNRTKKFSYMAEKHGLKELKILRQTVELGTTLFFRIKVG